MPSGDALQIQRVLEWHTKRSVHVWIAHGEIKRGLLSEAMVTLAKVMDIAQGMESTEMNEKKLKGRNMY